MPVAPRTSGLRSLLLVTVVLGAAAHLPLFKGQWLPVYDDMFRFQVFHFFFSNFPDNGALPLWIPYGTYGIQSAMYQMQGLSPAGYLTGLAGVLLGVKNALLLYKLSLVLDSLVLFTGTALLAGRVFRKKAAAWFVTLSAIFCVSLAWTYQPYWNLYAYCGLPWVLYCLVLFFENMDLRYLLLAGILEICFLVGNILYVAPLHLLMVTVFCLGVLVKKRSDLRKIRFDARPCLLLFLALAGLSLAFYQFVHYSLDYTINISEGRDLFSNRVSLDTFLTYSYFDLRTHLISLFSGNVHYWENTYYLGLVPFLLIPVAALFSREPLLYGFAGGLVVLVWITIGGVFATMLYYFPGMDAFRHISHLFGYFRFFALFCAGFGLQAILDRLENGRFEVSGKALRTRAALLAALAGATALDAVWTFHGTRADYLPLEGGEAVLFWLRVGLCMALAAGFLVLIRKKSPPGPGALGLVVAAVLSVTLFDVGGYYLYSAKGLRTCQVAFDPSVFDRQPLEYRARRTDYTNDSLEFGEGLSEEKWNLLLVMHDPKPICFIHFMAYPFTNLDPCYPKIRSELLNQFVFTMIAARGGRPTQLSFVDYLRGADVDFHRFAGCGEPKLRFALEVREAETLTRAVEMLHKEADPFETVVLFEPGRGAEPAASRKESPRGAIEVESFSPNRIKAKVDLRGDSPAWLVYADAFHPDWRATVNGNPVPIAQANVGFKAIRLNPGQSLVEMRFGSGFGRTLSGFWALLGLFTALFVFGTVGRACLTGE